MDFFEGNELTLPGITLTPTDCEAILLRANKLVEADGTMSEESALKRAYLDRLTVLGERGLAYLSKISDGALMEVLGSEIGHAPSSEEVAMFKRYVESGHSAQGVHSIAELWEIARRSVDVATGGVNVAVDERTDQVVAMGDESPTLLQKRALDEREGLPPSRQ